MRVDVKSRIKMAFIEKGMKGDIELQGMGVFDINAIRAKHHGQIRRFA
jgi:hypothetical protein